SWACGNDETGGGGGGGAPADASYWTSTAEGDLSNEANLGSLSSGLLAITVSDGVATPATYAGDACEPGDFVTEIAADGTVTCDTPESGSGSPGGSEGDLQINDGMGGFGAYAG